MRLTRRSSIKSFFALGLVGVLSMGFGVQAQSKGPVKIGSTLALTGPLAATGIVHKIVGEIAIEDINSRGGLLGR